MSKVLFLLGICIVVFSFHLPGQRTWGGAYLSFDVANDVFYLPLKTDQYFTSGMSLELGHRKQVRSPFSVANFATQTRYWRFTQNIYTPREIEATTLLTNDRPFASYLIATHGNSYTDTNLGFSLATAWTVGILGKYSGGGNMQNAFHEIVKFAEPLPGWIYEVKPDIILNYEVAFSQRIPVGQRLQLETGLKARLGTLYTNLNPAIALHWRAIRLNENRTLHFDLLADARLVGYDATLSGGLINRDVRYRGIVRPTLVVGKFGIDGRVQFDAWQLRGGVRYLSPEFDGGLTHAWAWMGISVLPGWRQLSTSRPHNRP